MKEQKFINAIKHFVDKKNKDNDTSEKVEQDTPTELSIEALLKIFKKANKKEEKQEIKKMKRLDSLDKVIKNWHIEYRWLRTLLNKQDKSKFRAPVVTPNRMNTNRSMMNTSGIEYTGK